MINQLSALRQSQYENISLLKLDGNILDLGGSKKSGYQQLIKGNHTITTVNIDASYGCDLVFDIEEKFPLKNKSFNHVICINVLEHIFNYQHVLQESYRILRSNGTITITTPFMHHLHACPYDYFRFTDQAYQKILTQAGFEHVIIKPLTKGLMSLLFQLTLEAYPPPILRPIGKYVSGRFDKYLGKLSKKYQLLSNRIPLGYFVTAVKKV